jgi:hypothetical protein
MSLQSLKSFWALVRPILTRSFSLVQRTLTSWQLNGELAWLRNQEVLDRLPAAERKECRKLVGDFDALLNRAKDLM